MEKIEQTELGFGDLRKKAPDVLEAGGPAGTRRETDPGAVNVPGQMISSRDPNVEAGQVEEKRALSPKEKAVIRAKALEVLHREFPKPLPTHTETPAHPAPFESKPLEPLVPAAAPISPVSLVPPPGLIPEALDPSMPASETEVMPARMLNEFVYCARLFYYEFVDGVFVESVDTARGSRLHQKVDSGRGDLPAASRAGKKKTSSPEVKGKDSAETTTTAVVSGDSTSEPAVKNSEGEAPDTIHSRSVQMGSERLGVIAKMDLVEVRGKLAQSEGECGATVGETQSGAFEAIEVCPVDYKAGAPREGRDGNELWDSDRIQLGVQALILRDNGYACKEGIIYYRATKQRVRLEITPELENWVRLKIDEARVTARGSMPPPLVNSPKCVRCSLAPVCLPDETRMLGAESAGLSRPEATPLNTPRRLMAARDDTRALYLNTPGLRVGCKEEVLQVKEKERLIDEFRMRDVSHVALFGNIQISTQAIQTLCEKEIPISYFSMGGWFYGITRGHTLKNIFLRVQQFRQAGDPKFCLALARKLVQGKIRNHRTMLMRNHIEAPPPALLRLKRASEDALEADTIEELLGIEGAAAALYFQNFGGMIKVGDAACDPPSLGSDGRDTSGNDEALRFHFEGRNRRPPTDPVNALLSMAYSLLTKDCTIAALAVGFDPYLGFYHQPRFGKPALALDLMEEFRPLIAESTVLNAINNRVITAKDFVRAGEAVNLSTPGRRRFFETYEQRMSSLLTHPLFDYKVSYRRALELQARIMAKALTGEILEYTPLTTR